MKTNTQGCWRCGGTTKQMPYYLARNVLGHIACDVCDPVQHFKDLETKVFPRRDIPGNILSFPVACDDSTIVVAVAS